MGSCESLMLDLTGGGLVYHRRRSSSVGQSQSSATGDAISYADAADIEANAAAAQFLRVPPIVMACIRYVPGGRPVRSKTWLNRVV